MAGTSMGGPQMTEGVRSPIAHFVLPPCRDANVQLANTEFEGNERNVFGWP